MAKITDVADFINDFAPFSTALPWDNCGLLVESESKEADIILVTLDITCAVAREAQALGARLIVSHHPVIFNPIKRFTFTDPLYCLAQYGIAAICAHTNLDLARGGVNDALAHQLLLHDVEPLGELNSNLLSLGRIGNFSLSAPADIALRYVKETLGARGLRYVPGPENIFRVAVGGGACAGLLERAARLGADLFVTGDVKHHELLLAQELGIALADAGHACTERVVLERLARCLHERFEDTAVVLSTVENDPAYYM